ncbi:hypothetical protein, partial [Klebsiella pneumoniae]|uniref:hypothetical protein n=1 Tax=Klebsiella pneumoniae TaxID=573 RepID=UPI001C55B5D3
STIVEADTILVLHRGQAVERGTHQQLLAAKGRYWQMYQLQLASASWRPRWAICPCCSTKISLASVSADRRWALIMTVRPSPHW